jgi:hypothetical protein
MTWKIWYVGLQTLEGRTPNEWAIAPEAGVLCVGVKFGFDEWGIMLGAVFSGSDWYWMQNGEIAQSHTSSDTLFEWLPSNAPNGAVLKRGQMTVKEEIAQAESDMIEWVTSNG